ncbi:MAG TPA: maleylpyruvate isomerase family mycothiol-dependent enzyme [Natronosporangium sp.]|nr:maleylpyruvate isomerase family mycothiol-dependent enzyme [Natronosporangium sp.]
MEPKELDPFDLYDAEAARLDAYFDSLDEAAWQRPSGCAGWSVRDVLAHLAGEEAYNHACLDGTVPELLDRQQREGAGETLDQVNEWMVRQRRGLPVAEVLAEWREANADTRRRMRERGRDGTVQTAVGPYPAGRQAFHYASELATHGDDVGVPVDPQEEEGRIAWRAQVGLMALDELASPVRVTPGPQGFEVRAEGAVGQLTPSEFVAATVGRLPAEHPLDDRIRAALVCLA